MVVVKVEVLSAVEAGVVVASKADFEESLDKPNPPKPEESLLTAAVPKIDLVSADESVVKEADPNIFPSPNAGLKAKRGKKHFSPQKCNKSINLTIFCCCWLTNIQATEKRIVWIRYRSVRCLDNCYR